MSLMYRTSPIRPISVRPNICQIVPTTFQGISSESATMTSTADDFQPVDGMDRARRTPNGISIARTDIENTHWRHKAECSTSPSITAANHSVPTNTERIGEIKSCTQYLKTVISGIIYQNATTRTTGKIRQQTLRLTTIQY